jgi:putative oxidoreductase
MKKSFSIFKKWTRPFQFQHWITDLIMALPRIICGYLLTTSFGSDKFGLPWSNPESHLALFHIPTWFAEDVGKFGAPFSWAPWFFAWMAAASEALGGLFLALGFQTRISGFLIVCTMLVAIFFQKWGSSTWEMLPAMGFLWVGLYGMLLGSGRFGADYLINKRFS